MSTDNLDPDRVSIARRAAMMGLPSDGHLADVFGMDMVQAATSPTGYTAAQAYYALDQATEAGDFMGARNVGMMSREEAAEVFGAYVEGYREGLDVSDGDAFGGVFSKGRIRRYNKQMDRYKAARSANNQKKAAKALGRMKALWGKMSETDRQGLTSPDQLAVPGVEVAKATSAKAKKIDAKISKDDDASTDAADAESSAEDAMGALFGAAGVKEYKCRKAYVEAAMKAIAEGNLGKVNLVEMWKKVEGRKGLPSPAEIKSGAKVTLDMVIPPTSSDAMGYDGSFGAEELEVNAEVNAEEAMGALFGADGVREYKSRKAYVEAAMKAIAEGDLGKVNLVKLWKEVEGRRGLPSPAEIKAGTKVTADMAIPPSSSSMGADDSDYFNRKAYVEAAVNAVATGRLGKVNLVKLWKLVKGRAGLPSPAEIKAGAPITLSMIAPASMGYDFGADGLPDDDSDIDAVLGADDDEDMDDLGADDDEDMDELGADDDDLGADDDEDMDELGYSAIGTRNAYRRNVKDLFQALEKGKSDKVRKNWIQIKEIYAKLDSNEKAQVKKPDAILASAGKLGQRELQLLVFATGKTKKQILGLGKVKAKEAAAAAEAAELEAAEAEAMGFAYGADDLPDDDSDIDSVLGADDDDDMDDLGADEDEGDDDFGVAGTLLAITAARRIGLGNPTAYAKYRRQFEKKVLKDRSTRGANLDWKQITSSWEKMKADEKKGLPSPQEFLADVAMKDFKGAVAGSGLDQTAVRKYVEKRKAALKGSKAYAMAYGADDLPDDDSDIDAVLGADDDDDMDDLGADDEDDDDFGIDEIEMDLDLDMQRALVNRYSGADAPFPAGGAAPFPGPRMAGSEVF